MRSGHLKRNCENKNKSYQCESNLTYMIKMNKITVIMIKKKKKKTEKENKHPDDNSVSMINCKTTVFLQTKSTYNFDDSSKRNYVVKVLFDPGSQQTYILQRIADQLSFTLISQQNMSVKTFGTDNINDMLLNEYNFSLMGIKTNYL